MNDKTVQLTVHLSIHEGSFAEFERTAQAMCVRCQDEPGTLAYSWFLSDDRKKCRLIELYTDAKAAAAHLTGPVVRDLVPKLLQSANVTGFEVNGDPGPEATAILRGFGAQIFKHWHSMSR
jgi:quinol monooxygenase YgiN